MLPQLCERHAKFVELRSGLLPQPSVFAFFALQRALSNVTSLPLLTVGVCGCKQFVLHLLGFQVLENLEMKPIWDSLVGTHRMPS